MKYKHLFQPCSVGTLQLKNRIIMPPLTTNYAKDGLVSDRMIDFYRVRARGGAAMIIVEDAIVEVPRGKHTLNDLAIDRDDCIAGLRRLSQAIKESGCVAAIHLNHSGFKGGRMRENKLFLTDGQVPVAPSALSDLTEGFAVPHEMTVEDIIDIENKYAGAAYRAKQAGFSAVVLHCSHGYLIEQFLSPFSNKRQDNYGGDLYRRFRFLKEIIARIKGKVGDDFPLLCRISGMELWDGGIVLDDAKENARMLQDCGIYGISMSISSKILGPAYSSFVPVSASPMRGEREAVVQSAAAIKQVVSIPVMAVNRLNEPGLAEDILEHNKADLIGIARGLVADPEWPNKVEDGRENEIRPCICCNHCFMGSTGKPLTCATNPVAGREKEMEIVRTDNPKTVFIAGAGPAGLEAARVAGLRGHEVHLYEKETLGGLLNLASLPAGKDPIKDLVSFELAYIHKLGVQIVNKELTLDIVSRDKPDAVIVATGASPVQRKYPGNRQKDILDIHDALSRDITNRKIVVIGGKHIGAETAEVLAARGNKVTLVEESDKIAGDIAHLVWLYDFLLVSLRLSGVTMLTGTTIDEVTDSSVVVIHDSQRIAIEADLVVMAQDSKANRTLVDQLSNLNIELYSAGDCTGTGKILKALKEGYLAGLAL
jgi:2,4-dienoyl-CoA reductase-like NADH-dependent reductase (Old Yellow Enzyme family)/thioredoxin reductase